jgi:hypothetical protein
LDRKSVEKKFPVLKIPSTTLDSYIKMKKITHIDMMKIDVEGAEYKVLKGARDLLEKGKIGLLLLEISDKTKLYGYDFPELASFLSKYQYSIYEFGGGGKISKTVGLPKVSNHPKNIIAVHKNKISALKEKMRLYRSCIREKPH